MCFVRGNLHSDDNGCNTFNVRAHNQLTDDSTLTTGWYCSCCRHRCHRRLCFCRGDEYNLFGRNIRRRRGITWIITRLFDRTRSRALSRSLSLSCTRTHIAHGETWRFMLRQYEVIITRRHTPNANVTSQCYVFRAIIIQKEKKSFLRHFESVHTHPPTAQTQRNEECTWIMKEIIFKQGKVEKSKYIIHSGELMIVMWIFIFGSGIRFDVKMRKIKIIVRLWSSARESGECLPPPVD